MVDYTMPNFGLQTLQTIQGLQGIQANQEQLAQQRQQRLMQQQQQEQMTAARQQASELIQSGTPEQIAKFSMQNPELGKELRENMQFRNQATEANLMSSMREIIANPDDTEAIMMRRIKTIQEQGGDPSTTVKGLQDYRNNPEQFVQGVERTYAMMDPAGYNAYAKTRPGTKEPSPHTNIRTTEDGQMIGYNPETRSYETIPSPAAAASGAPQVNVNINEQPEFEKEIQKLNAKAYNQINTSSAQTRAEENKINRLMELNEKAFAGGGADVRLAASRMANVFGVDVEGLPESEAFRAISNELVLDKSQQMSGALSDGDMAFLRDTVPNLGNTTEGRKQVFEYSKKLIDRNKEYAKQARQFKKDNGYFDLGEFEEQFQAYADENPLFGGTQDFSNLWG